MENSKKYYRDFLDYLEINENQFNEIVESWRSSKIWKSQVTTGFKISFKISLMRKIVIRSIKS